MKLLRILGYSLLWCASTQALANQHYFDRFVNYMVWSAELPNPITQEFMQFIEGNRPLSRYLREKWLYDLAQRQDWVKYEEQYKPSHDVSLQCYAKYALYQNGKQKRAIAESQPLWLTGDSQPPACDKLFTLLFNEHAFNDTLLSARLNLALEKNNIGLANYLYKKITHQTTAAPTLLEQIHKTPAQISILKPGGIHGALYLYGLKRLFAQNAEKAVALWLASQPKHILNAQQNQSFIAYVALHKAIRNQPDVEQWFTQLSTHLKQEPILEWQLRFALKHQHWENVEPLYKQTANRSQPMWQYWRARSLEALNHLTEAKEIYQKLSKTRQYYGFLASARLHSPFAFNEEADLNQPEHIRIYQPIMDLIKTFYQSKQYSQASRLINNFSSELPKDEKCTFIHWINDKLNWYAKSIYLSSDDSVSNQLSLRFPLVYRKYIKREANHLHVPEALTYAVIRQESAFSESVISMAGAHGLMQLMPATARWISLMNHIPYSNQTDLFRTSNNIHLGTLYLNQLSKRFNRQGLLVVAAYNAGPSQVKQWLTAFPLKNTDIWVETIPYNETRNYVKNIISFYLVYQQQLKIKPSLDYFLKVG